MANDKYIPWCKDYTNSGQFIISDYTISYIEHGIYIMSLRWKKYEW